MQGENNKKQESIAEMLKNHPWREREPRADGRKDVEIAVTENLRQSSSTKERVSLTGTKPF